MSESKMSNPAIEIPTAIHHSHQSQQMDLGETIYLFKGEGPDGPRSEVGEIYNAEEFPCLEDEQYEDFEAMAIAFANKVVRAYNCHDDLLAALETLLAAVKTVPQMNHRRFDQVGIQVNAAIAKAKRETR